MQRRPDEGPSFHNICQLHGCHSKDSHEGTALDYYYYQCRFWPMHYELQVLHSLHESLIRAMVTAT